MKWSVFCNYFCASLVECENRSLSVNFLLQIKLAFTWKLTGTAWAKEFFLINQVQISSLGVHINKKGKMSEPTRSDFLNWFLCSALFVTKNVKWICELDSFQTFFLPFLSFHVYSFSIIYYWLKQARKNTVNKKQTKN